MQAMLIMTMTTYDNNKTARMMAMEVMDLPFIVDIDIIEAISTRMTRMIRITGMSFNDSTIMTKKLG